jgi:2-methylisocitrate lyase-like PEP mutase family enzyme
MVWTPTASCAPYGPLAPEFAEAGADMEAGYGLAPTEFVERLLEAGAVGCNLEDSVNRSLVDPERQADYLAEVRAAAGADLVINARVDVFIRGGDPEDAIARGRAYRRAGADCIYPILAPVEQLAEVVQGVGGPVNAHAAPDGPTVADLVGAGATRISYGTSIHNHLMDGLRELLPRLR